MHGYSVHSNGDPANCPSGHSLLCTDSFQNPYSVVYKCQKCAEGFFQSEATSVPIYDMNCNKTEEYNKCAECEDGTVSNDDRTKCEGK